VSGSRTLAAVAVVASVVLARVGSSQEGVHVVEPGETLWQIAAVLAGDAYRWPELYRANRDQIKDPSLLYPGQRLAIPDFGVPADVSRPEGVSASGEPPGD
jgi:nucleoid-associated protein YgaU